MLLGDWMKSNGVTQVKLAELSGVRQSFISGFLAGKKGFGKHTAAKIVKTTKGRVTLEELLFPDKCGNTAIG